jgi:hypothetical protein
VKALVFGPKRLKVLKYRGVNGFGQIASGQALHQLCEERPAADLRLILSLVASKRHNSK